MCADKDNRKGSQQEEVMPYRIEKKKNEYCIINTETGENKGCSDTREKAIAHQRLLYGIEHGWKPTKTKK